MSGWELILSSRKMKMIANVLKMVSYSLIFIAYNKAVLLLLLLYLAIHGASQKILYCIPALPGCRGISFYPCSMIFKLYNWEINVNSSDQQQVFVALSYFR